MSLFSLLFSIFKKTKIPLRFPHRLYFIDVSVLLLLSKLFPVELLESFELLALCISTGENGHRGASEKNNRGIIFCVFGLIMGVWSTVIFLRSD